MNRKLISAFIFLLSANIFCFAQVTRENSKTNELAVEITYHKELKPAYLAIREEGKISGVWFAKFQRVPNWNPPAESLPVRAVNFVSKREGKAVKVDVSVYTGQKLFEREESVISLIINENDKIVVKDLLKFGVEPFEISLVRITPTVGILPVVNNKSSSVTVANLEPTYSALPSYKMTLANNSSKAVSAFTFDIKVGDKIMGVSTPQGKEGRPLIEAGGFYERTFKNANQPVKVSEGQTFPVEPDQIFTISSVIFEDGTFEGDELQASMFMAFNLGRKIQVKRIVDLLRQNSQNKLDLGVLKKQAENLNVSVNETDFKNLAAKLPGLSNAELTTLQRTVQFTTQSLKNEFVDDIRIKLKGNSQAKLNRKWFAENLERYENWLARLK